MLVTEVTEVLEQVDPKESTKLAEEINQAKRVFVAGTGRSGLIGKVFAMRMMHSGYPIYVVGETITPSIETGDLLLIISGSGSTATLKHFATKAKEVEAKLALVTTNRKSDIGQISDYCVNLPAATKRRLKVEPETIQPLGSQFDQSAHILMDAIVVYLLQNLAKSGRASLNQKHANLE